MTVRVRFLTATNEDLRVVVEEGRFRENLYHRLAVVRIEVPPLRGRGGDIRQIAADVVREYSQRHNTGDRQLGASAALLIEAYHWPGNVRELRNVMERAVLMMVMSCPSPGHRYPGQSRWPSTTVLRALLPWR